jgi:hypothetical protein
MRISRELLIGLVVGSVVVVLVTTTLLLYFFVIKPKTPSPPPPPTPGPDPPANAVQSGHHIVLEDTRYSTYLTSTSGEPLLPGSKIQAQAQVFTIKNQDQLGPIKVGSDVTLWFHNQGVDDAQVGVASGTTAHPGSCMVTGLQPPISVATTFTIHSTNKDVWVTNQGIYTLSSTDNNCTGNLISCADNSFVATCNAPKLACTADCPKSTYKLTVVSGP